MLPIPKPSNPTLPCAVPCAVPCAPCPARSTFTEEAERTCKGDFLCDKMSLSASGLLYHFDKAPADYSYGYKKHDEEYKKEEVGIWGCD